MTDVQTIVAKLTKAQRECFADGDHVGFIYQKPMARAALVRKGLAEPTSGWASCSVFNWTPLGLAVRQALEGER